jgi:hypothetical protein
MPGMTEKAHVKYNRLIVNEINSAEPRDWALASPLTGLMAS